MVEISVRSAFSWLIISFLITVITPRESVAAPPAADSVSLAIVPFEAESAYTGAADELLTVLRKLIEGDQDLTEVGPVVMSLEDARLTLGCFDEQPVCMAQVGANFKADWLMWGKLTTQDDGWWFEVAIIEVNSKKVLQQSRLRAEGEGWQASLAEQIFDILLRQIRPAEVKVTFLSNPTGARINLDGRPRGRTPVAMRLPVGEHSVTVEMDTRRVTQRFSLQQSQGPRTIEIALPPAPPEVVVKPKKPTEGDNAGLWLGVGSGVIALGAATASTIIGLDVLDLQSQAEDRKAANEPFSDLEAEFNRKRTLANVGWAVTAVAAGTAVYFLWFYEETPEQKSSVGVTASPGGLLLHGRF
ncbi:MAG: PEGA domain-containing protein [Bradymonadia bacterium]